MRSLLIQARELERVLELNRRQIESAREKTEAERELYGQGRGELTFVLQSRNSEQAASLQYAENATRYHQLLLTYRELTDGLLEPQAVPAS